MHLLGLTFTYIDISASSHLRISSCSLQNVMGFVADLTLIFVTTDITVTVSALFDETDLMSLLPRSSVKGQAHHCAELNQP